jgi:hypothetical protein
VKAFFDSPERTRSRMTTGTASPLLEEAPNVNDAPQKSGSSLRGSLCSGFSGVLPGMEDMDWHRPSDVVLTPDAIAADIVSHFQPTGRVLDPCKGNGAFLKHMPGAEWCEIREGRDFFAWHDRVDWLVSNPPYSIFADWMTHSLKIANDIVYLIPLAKVFSAEKRIRDIYRVGGIVAVRLYGSGTALGFPFGWPCGAVHVRVGYRGPMDWSFYIPNVASEPQRKGGSDAN